MIGSEPFPRIDLPVKKGIAPEKPGSGGIFHLLPGNTCDSSYVNRSAMATAVSKFEYLKKNLILMAELALEQVLLLVEAMEMDDYRKAAELIERDDLMDELEKENDTQSQNAILEAVASREEILRGTGQELDRRHDPLIFAMSAIRLTRSFERMGDHVVNAARAFKNGHIRAGMFRDDERLAVIQSRVVTIVGSAVESLVEEKDRFYGSVQKVEDELDAECSAFFLRSLDEESYSRREFADLYRILLSLERIGDLAVNIAMELVRLQTGRDIRHLFPSLSARDM